MSNTFIVAGVVLLFVSVIITGIWLTRLGRPLNAILFNLHKLVSVGFVVFGFFSIRTLLRNADTVGGTAAAMLVIAVVSLIVLFVTGGFLSAKEPARAILLPVHFLAPFPTAVCTAIAIFALIKNA